ETPTEELHVDPAEAAVPIAVPASIGPLATARRFELDNGLKVVLVPTAAPLPILSASVIFGGGRAAEPAMLAGAAHGARAFAPPPARREGCIESSDGFAELGIGYGASTPADHTIFSTHGLTIYQKQMLEGLEHMLEKTDYHARAFEQLHERADFMLRPRGVRAA